MQTGSSDRHQSGTLDTHPSSAIPGEVVWSKSPIHLLEEARERWPLMNEKDVIGAVWSPDDGRVILPTCAPLWLRVQNPGEQGSLKKLRLLAY